MNIENQILKILGNLRESKVNRLYLHAPFLKSSSIKYVKEIINDGEISAAGAYVSKFEKGIAELCNKKFALSLNSGTSALHLSLIALGIKPGDEVFVPNLTFVATANAVSYCGATPHFVEIEKESFGIDVEKLEHYIEKTCSFKSNVLINRRTKNKITAIIGVYVFGKSFNTNDVANLAKKYSLKYIEDAAGALGTTFNKISIGNFADIAVISFNGNKILTTGNGGMVLTDNKELAIRIAHLKSTAKVNNYLEFTHDEIGFNYRLSNINAAIGYAQLEYFSEIMSIKRNIMTNYKNIFDGNKNFIFVYRPEFEESNNWLNTLLLRENIVDQKDSIIRNLQDIGIEVRPAWNLINSLKPYKLCPSMKTPMAAKLQSRILNLPSGKGVKIAN